MLVTPGRERVNITKNLPRLTSLQMWCITESSSFRGHLFETKWYIFFSFVLLLVCLFCFFQFSVSFNVHFFNSFFLSFFSKWRTDFRLLGVLFLGFARDFRRM